MTRRPILLWPSDALANPECGIAKGIMVAVISEQIAAARGYQTQSRGPIHVLPDIQLLLPQLPWGSIYAVAEMTKPMSSHALDDLLPIRKLEKGRRF